VSAATRRSEPGVSRRAARILSWFNDSSPEMYNVFTPPAESSAAVCRSSVDLPMPGSPPINTKEPSTTPPPRTRSNSAMPVETRCSSRTGTSLSAITAPCEGPDAAGAGFPPQCPGRLLDPSPREASAASAGASLNSIRLSQVPQDGQRPAHLEKVSPHSLQAKVTLLADFEVFSGLAIPGI